MEREFLFEEVLEIKNGKNQRLVEDKDGKYPIYGSGGIMGYANDYICEANTVVIGRKGNINNPLYVMKPFWNVDTAFGLVANREYVLPKYLYYFCKKYNFEALNKTVTIPSLTKADLLKIKILLPDISKQQKIIDRLDKICTIINLRKQELNQLQKMVKARFVEMFDNGNYPIEKLGTVCKKITDGTHKTPTYLDEGITFISAKNIVNGELDFTDIKHISESEYQEIQKRCQTAIYDILLSKSGSLGSPVIVKTEEKLGLFESLAILKYDREKLIPEFLCEQLKTDRIQRQFTTGTKGVAIKHLHLGVIADTDIIVPSLDEQKIFANFVNQVNKSKLKPKQNTNSALKKYACTYIQFTNNRDILSQKRKRGVLPK